MYTVFTLRSCVMSGLSSLGERSMVRDSLLPDSPRVKTVPDKKTRKHRCNNPAALTDGMLCRVVCVPAGLTLLREEVRNRKLLGLWACPGGGDVFGEHGTSDTNIQVNVTDASCKIHFWAKSFYRERRCAWGGVPVLLLERCRCTEGDPVFIWSAL